MLFYSWTHGHHWANWNWEKNKITFIKAILLGCLWIYGYAEWLRQHRGDCPNPNLMSISMSVASFQKILHLLICELCSADLLVSCCVKSVLSVKNKGGKGVTVRIFFQCGDNSFSQIWRKEWRESFGEKERAFRYWYNIFFSNNFSWCHHLTYVSATHLV